MSEPRSQEAMARRMIVFVAIVAVLSGAMLAGVIVVRRIVSARSGPGGLNIAGDAGMRSVLDSMVIPEFELVDTDGNVVTRELFLGQWTVLDFMFSHCNMACPAMSQNMLDVAERISSLPVRIVSISVDPVNDNPLTLRAYAQKLGADESQWKFLSGDAETVHRIAVEGLGFSLEDDPANPINLGDGRVMNNIAHPTRFMLISPDGRVAGMYRGLERKDLDRLVADLHRMHSRRR